jgi:tetratricopeptide (TPR) repeat protein
VRVVARSSVLRLKGERVDVRALGEMLGVKVVLGGSVRRDGERLRITVELINAGDGYQLWSRQFDARMTNVFQVQEGIASAVVDALRPGLSDMRKPRSEPEGFALEAYSMYVRGRQFWNSETLEGYGRAIGCFEDTIAEWPGYARAYSGLADSYAELVYAGVLHPGEGMPRARTSALKALELDDGLSEAYLSLAMVLGLFEWDWAGGELAFMRAVQHGNYSAAHRIYGLFLTAMGRFEQGMDQLETARKLDPLSPQVQTALGFAYYEQRRYDQAIRHLRTLVETSEASAIAHVFLGLSYVQNSSPADALETIEKAPLAGSPVIQGAAAQVLALAGRPDKARRTLEEIRGVGQLLYVTPVSFAMLDLALGDTESALSWLDEGYDQRAPCMLWLNVDPRYDRIRGHPRFIALMNQMRFPSFARAEAIHGAA